MEQHRMNIILERIGKNLKGCWALCLTVAGLMAASSASAADTRHGYTVYHVNCAGCHGQMAQGNIGPKLADEPAHWSFALFSRAMLKNLDDQGKPLGMPMPNWGKVGFKGDMGKPPSSTEISDLQAFLKTLK